MIFFNIAMRGWFTAALVVSLTGCVGSPRVSGLAADQVVIVDAFERKFVGRDNILEALHECMPLARSLKDPRDWQLPTPSRQVRTISTPEYRSYLMISGSQSVCIQETIAGYPVLPVEAFERWANFIGVPRAEQQEWFRQIAKLVAVHGSAALVVSNGKGNAHVLTYAAGLRVRGQIFLNWRSVKPGQSVPATEVRTLNVVASRMTGMQTIRHPYAASAGDAIPAPFAETLFSDTPLSDYYKPAPPTRIERSVLTDAPAAAKPK